jgi:hypothetical protein
VCFPATKGQYFGLARPLSQVTWVSIESTRRLSGKDSDVVPSGLVVCLRREHLRGLGSMRGTPPFG